MIGTRNRIAEVLSRKRGLSIEMIRNLHDKLGISAEVLIRSHSPRGSGLRARRENIR
jgi:plasmid maintenance system antidote protein VapI